MLDRAWLVALAGLSGAGSGFAQTPLGTVRVASGLTRPVFVTHAPGDVSRLFIVEQRGSGGVENQADIKILDLGTGAVNPAPFLRVSGVSFSSNEKGLLGLAFHPEFASNGWFYIDYTTSSGGRGERIVVERYRVSADPDAADPASAEVVLEIPHPNRIHHGGWLAFGGDGYLWVSVGDGGPQGDPNHNAQNLDLLLGKILRIDVNGDDFPDDPLRNYAVPPTNPFVGADGADEIWAYGLRNPWRPTLDPATGDLWIADVGWNEWEEVNVEPGAGGGGENYGWPCYEGLAPLDLAACQQGASLAGPVHVYPHGPRCAVTGGCVYRGCAIPDLHGAYFFADYCTGQVWSMRYDGAAVTELVERTAELDPADGTTIGLVSSFGEDALGELYICDSDAVDGSVYRIVAGAPPEPDCNGDGLADACDVLSGSSEDGDGDGVPDECQCRAELDGSGGLTLDDFVTFRNLYVAGDPRADFDRSGGLSLNDFVVFRNEYAAGCP